MSINSNSSDAARTSPYVASALWTFQGYLRSRQLRFTSQRRAVLEETMARSGHFDAEDLHRSLRSSGKDVSLATIYRTLGLLAEAGLIREVLQGADSTHYEAVYGHAHHDHMICVECGRVIEFCDERIEELQRSICRERGFQALDHRMGIQGICRTCRRAGARRRWRDADES